MKVDKEQLYDVGLVINEPGFKIVEGLIAKQMGLLNDVGRIIGHPFEDGQLSGEVKSLKYTIKLFADLRSELKINEEKK